MFAIKGLLVFLLLAAGSLFLLTGLGIEVPLIKYKGLEAHGVPAGVVLLIAGIALSKFWKISKTTSTKQTRITFPDGSYKLIKEKKSERWGIR